MGRRYDTVSFLTDYGVVDEFAGVVRSVIRDLAPHVTVVDLTHGIRPFDVRGGSLALARSIGYVAPGVVLAVVDPGVGSSRRAVAIEVAGGEGVLVGPDNGLLAPAVAMVGGAERAVELTNPQFQLEGPSATFAGRDVFGPAAAHLCNGVDLTDLGQEIDVDLLMPGIVPLAQIGEEIVIAQVLWIDQFGNVQLNVGPADLPPGFGDHISLRMDSPTEPSGTSTRSARRATSFSEIGGGAVGLVVDSSGLLAVAMDQRSAAEELGLDVGDQVTLRAGEPDDGTDGLTQSVTIRPR
jgi:S-adenosyl-L-methionine hydrolase (adenosine-forming)